MSDSAAGDGPPTGSAFEERLALLVARAEIQELPHRYARAVDRSDWDLLRSVFHPGAELDHAAYRGDVDGFVAYVQGRRAGIVHTAHFVSNVLVDFLDPASAIVEAYGQAVQTFRTAPDSSGGTPSHWGTRIWSCYRYVDQVELRAGRWGVTQAMCVLGEVRREVLFEEPPALIGTVQTPSLQDPLYLLMAGQI